MKSFLKWLTGMLVLIMLTITIFALIVDAGEKYKSFSQLHPKQAEKYNVRGLGETSADDGTVFRVMGEAKHTTVSQWYQLIDLAPFDGICDKIAVFYMDFQNDQFSIVMFRPADGGELIQSHCKNHNIKLKDFLHLAPLRPKISKPEVLT